MFPARIFPLIDAYNTLFGVLNDTDDQLSRCKKALENACLRFLQCRDNDNGNDDLGDSIILTHREDGLLVLMVCMGGQVEDYLDEDDYHRYLPFRHKFSNNVDIDRNQLWHIEDEDLPQRNPGLSSTHGFVADVCLGLLIVINHLNECQIKSLSEAFEAFEIKLWLMKYTKYRTRWCSTPPRRQLRVLRTLCCKNKSGSCWTQTDASAPLV